MNTLLNILRAICILIPLLLFASCSDDKGTNGADVTQAQYLQMQAMTNETVVPMATAFLSSGMARLDGVSPDDYGLGKAAVPESDSVMVVYHPLSGWWEAYFYTESDAGEDPFYQVTLRDSIQFKSVSGNNQIAPNDSTDYVHDIPRASIVVESDSLNTSLAVTARNDIVYDNLQSEVANIDGPMSLHIEMEIDTLGKNIMGAVTATLLTSDLEIPIPVTDEEEVCPLSGVITYTLEENISSQFVSDETRNTVWSVRITIVDAQTYLIKISAGSIEFDEYQLDSEYVCDNSLLNGAVGKAVALIRH